MIKEFIELNQSAFSDRDSMHGITRHYITVTLGKYKYKSIKRILDYYRASYLSAGESYNTLIEASSMSMVDIGSNKRIYIRGQKGKYTYFDTKRFEDKLQQSAFNYLTHASVRRLNANLFIAHYTIKETLNANTQG